MTPDQIRKGDGIVTRTGSRGIVTAEAWKAVSHFDYDLIRVEFDVCEMPLQVASVAEVWRNGVRIDQLEQVEQLELWEQGA